MYEALPGFDQFDDIHVAGPIYRVDLRVVIEQYEEVVETLLDTAVLLRTARVQRAEHLETEAVYVGEM